MNDPVSTRLTRADALGRSSFRHPEADERGHHREDGGCCPRQGESVLAEHELTDERPDRDARVQREGDQAQRLPAAVLRRKVGGDREGGHEEGSLGHAEDEPHDDEQLHGGRHDVPDHPHRQEHRPSEQQGPPAALVRERARPRPEQERGDAERPEHQARAPRRRHRAARPRRRGRWAGSSHRRRSRPGWRRQPPGTGLSSAGGGWRGRVAGVTGRRSLDSGPMSEPCACPPEHPEARPPIRAPLSDEAGQIGQHFDERFQDWEPVGPEATDLMLSWLRDEGLAGSTIMDVGCGTGELLLRALEAGATRGTGADLSSEAIAMASELIEEAGMRRPDRPVGRRRGGRAARSARRGRARQGHLLLPRRRCAHCPLHGRRARGSTRSPYPSRGASGASWPETRWLVFGILGWIQGDCFPRFIHDRADVEAQVLAAGFRPLHTGRRFVWFVGVYARI